MKDMNLKRVDSYTEQMTIWQLDIWKNKHKITVDDECAIEVVKEDEAEKKENISQFIYTTGLIVTYGILSFHGLGLLAIILVMKISWFVFENMLVYLILRTLLLKILYNNRQKN